MPAIDLQHAIGLPPEEAIRYFEQKGYVMGFRWQDVWQEAHAQAFTVAGVMKLDILEDLRTGLTAALKNGSTLAEYKNRLIPLLQQKGWLGRGYVTDPDTGEISGKRLTGRRLDTIFRTNMQTAFMAGRYTEQMRSSGERPYWEYVAVLDTRTRPAHRLLAGRVFRFDDPFWRSHYPPNGWNCRCRVRSRRARDVEREPLPVSNSDGHLETVQQPVGQHGETRPTTGYRDPVSNQLVIPDAGWGYNPGAASLAHLGQLTLERAVSLDPQMAALAIGQLLEQPRTLQALVADHQQWTRSVLERGQARGELRHVGALPSSVLQELARRQQSPASAVVSIRDEDLLHALRDSKVNPLPMAAWEQLAAWVHDPVAILLDRTQAKPALLYVYSLPNSKGKLVVVMDYEVKARHPLTGERERFPTNLVRTGKQVEDVTTLLDPVSYELLWGSV